MQALFYPLRQGFVPLTPGRALMINPGIVTGGRSFFPGAQPEIWQWGKAAADFYTGQGLQVFTDVPPEGSYDRIFLRLPRQREEGLGLIAAAHSLLAPDGILLIAAANDAGGSRLEKILHPFAPALQGEAKHKCRVVWARKQDIAPLPQSWAEDASWQRHTATGFWTRPGLFSWDRFDTATAMLLPFLPQGQAGTFADLGCGYGAIAAAIAAKNPGLSKLVCLDADARALEACRRNLAESEVSRKTEFVWADLSVPGRDITVDHAVMNPPFHQDRAQAVALGQAFIARAAGMLRPGGNLLMVANAHLPYEYVLQKHFAAFEKLTEAQGFKIFQARR